MEVPIHRFRNKKCTRPVRIAVTINVLVWYPAPCCMLVPDPCTHYHFLTIIIIMRKSTNSHNHDNDVIVTSLITTDKM